MNINKAIKRDSKRNKKRSGMRRDGDSVKTIERIQRKRRDQLLQKKRKAKENERTEHSETN